MASKAQREAVRSRADKVNAAIGSFRKSKHSFARLPLGLQAALAASSVIGNAAAALTDRNEPAA